jgi:DNA-binding transcriptional MerR regulator
MTDPRAHLSIGEVLTLLQPEFPDITISKIRFLESQGLLDPERTPSGYRKFHDDDIERLRWILTQQRDHFLPLKVIKDRLASGDLTGDAGDGVLPLAAEPPMEAPTPIGVGAGTARLGDARSASAREHPSGEQAGDPGPSVSTASSAPGDNGADAATGARPPLTLLKRAGVVADEPVSNDEPVSTDEPADHERARTVAHLVEGPEIAPPPPAPETATADETAPPGRRRHPTGHSPGEPPADPDSSSNGRDGRRDSADVTLSLEDLAAATGLTARELGELERYGLLAARSMGAVDYYDEDALIVARLAVGFRRYGIEPRHLRMYKVAAEREAGLFEQLITPLLKQRRPSARQEAVEMLEDLAELADDLRAAMVRSALRAYLGQA